MEQKHGQNWMSKEKDWSFWNIVLEKKIPWPEKVKNKEV